MVKRVFVVIVSETFVYGSLFDIPDGGFASFLGRGSFQNQNNRTPGMLRSRTFRMLTTVCSSFNPFTPDQSQRVVARVKTPLQAAENGPGWRKKQGQHDQTRLRLLARVAKR